MSKLNTFLTLLFVVFFVKTIILFNINDNLETQLSSSEEQNKLLKIFISTHGYNIPNNIDHEFVINSSKQRNLLCKKENDMLGDYSELSVDQMIEAAEKIKKARENIKHASK